MWMSDHKFYSEAVRYLFINKNYRNMAMFGHHWLEDDYDDYDGGILSRKYKNDDFEYPNEIEKPKHKLSNQEIIKILKSRSKKDLNLILKGLDDKR